MSDSAIPEFVPGKPPRRLLADFARRPSARAIDSGAVREFIREPEALSGCSRSPFACGRVGHCVSQRPAEVLKIAAVTPELAQSLRQENLLDVQQLDSDAAEESLRTGKVALFAEPGPRGTVVYRMTIRIRRPRRPDARGSSYTKGAGRADPVSTSDELMREPGHATSIPDSGCSE